MTARRTRRGDRRLDTKEAAEELGYKPATLRCWRQRGEGPPFEQPKGPRGKAFYWLSDLRDRKRWKKPKKGGR